MTITQHHFSSIAAYRFTLDAPHTAARDAAVEALGYTFKLGWQIAYNRLTETLWHVSVVRDRLPHSPHDAPPPRVTTVRQWLTAQLPDVGRCDYVQVNERGYGIGIVVPKSLHTDHAALVADLLDVDVHDVRRVPFQTMDLLYIECLYKELLRDAAT